MSSTQQPARSNSAGRLWWQIGEAFTRPAAELASTGAQRQARFLSAVTLTLIFFVGVRIAVALRSGSYLTDPSFVVYPIVFVTTLLAYGLSRTRFLALSVLILSIGLNASSYATIFLRDTQDSASTLSTMLWLLIGFFAGALLLPWGASVIWMVANLVMLAVFPLLTPKLLFDDIASLLYTMLVLTGVTAIVTRFRDQVEADRRKELLDANRQLEDSRVLLEARVQTGLNELALAAEVGRSISQIRDLDALLKDAVERIRNAFDLYYTQIYLTDSVGTALVMQSGTGTVGAELKRRSFRLPIGSGSINGTAAATRQDVLVADTAQSSTFRPNPLLPETRSELAVPMVIGDKVVGVLDLQSNRPNAFSENQLAFDVLAAQLAVSIENNTLFSETQTARATVEQQARRLTQGGWENFLDAIHRQEVIQADYVGERSLPYTSTQPLKPQVLSAPITVIGQPIGALSLETAQPLSESETQLVNAVAEQVGRQIESIRLISQAEQYRAEAEQTIRRYTQEGWTAFTEQKQTVEDYEYDGTQVRTIRAETNGHRADYVQPIVVRGETIGEVDLDGMPVIDDRTTQLLESVTNQLSLHIENLRLAEQTQNALAQTETLYSITGDLNAANSLTKVLATIGSIKQSSRVTLMAIGSSAEGHPETVTIAAHWPEGAADATPVGTRLPLSRFPAAQHWIDNPDMPLFYEDMATDPALDEPTRQFNLRLNIRGAIYLALRVGEQWVGLLGISWNTPQQFSFDDRQLYRAVAAQAAVVVNNRILFEQANKRAEREATINLIAQKIQSTSSVEKAIETTIEELGRTLQAKRTTVKLATKSNEP